MVAKSVWRFFPGWDLTRKLYFGSAHTTATDVENHRLLEIEFSQASLGRFLQEKE